MLPLPAAKRKLGVGDGDILCLMKAALPRRAKIIEAMEGIRAFSGPRTVLAVIGEKPGDMDANAQDVFLPRAVSREEDMALKYGCDIYIYFAKRDSLELPLLEAGLMSCAAVCILPEGEFKFNTVVNLETGLVVSCDLEEIKAALQKLRLHTKLRLRIFRKAEKRTSSSNTAGTRAPWRWFPRRGS